MSLLKGLPFEPGGIPRVLILGSFPSPLSLAAGEYYANPRNQFWKIMEVHLGISTGLPYTEKLAGLKNRNIGLWDVIFSCERHGAMDHAIRNVTLNHIPHFLNHHTTVRMVIANGSTAGRYIGKSGMEWPSRVSVYTLPSTSPANARTSFSEKLRAWEVVLQYQ
ncbi:MAG: DNA-deoxyinosine glycosylase, partial [Methanomicrobiales archaeon]|nr:DNA-deoxyinosine glycosylase [Methanomicrobiales archaeon]